MLWLIEFLGIVTFALSGIVTARRKGLDLVGVFTVAMVTAFGGGTLRDLLIDRTPLFWIANQSYVVVVLLLALAAVYLRGLGRLEAWDLTVPDALGLGLFAISGAAYAEAAGTGVLIAALLGVITATWGGVFRDMIVNEIPFIFRSRYLYATCAFLGCLAYFGLVQFGVEREPALLLGVALIVGLRLASLRWHIRVPGAA